MLSPTSGEESIVVQPDPEQNLEVLRHERYLHLARAKCRQVQSNSLQREKREIRDARYWN